MKITLNADIGESYGRYRIGQDGALMPLIQSANIACAMHAGDPTIMAETLQLARQHRVSLGAHPGFNDLWGFGRRQIRMAPKDLQYLVTYQIGALQALAREQGGRISHVKPHGALNNMAHDQEDYALAIGRGIKAADPELIFVANARSAMTRAAEKLDLPVAHEAYVDRVYDDNGKMLSRDNAQAVIRDPEQAVKHVLRMLQEGALFSLSGKKLPTPIHTLCIHGDEPTAVLLASAVAKAIQQAGVSLAPLPEVCAPS